MGNLNPVPVPTPELSPSKQILMGGAAGTVHSGGAAAGFALILFLFMNRFGVFGSELQVTEAVLIQGAFSVAMQTVFGVGWSLFKQMMHKRGYEL